jgi:ABC-type amino acid transport substrate-binding protein
LSDPKILLYDSDTVATRDGRLQALKMVDSTENYMAFSFRQNWEFGELFNYHLLKMEESGILDRIRKNWTNLYNHKGRDSQLFHLFL